MATPPYLPPIQTLPPLAGSAPFQAPSYPHETNMPDSPTTASAMELSHSTMIAPPPAPSAFREELLDSATDAQNTSNAVPPPQAQADYAPPDPGSGGEDEDDDDDDEDDDEDDDGEDGHSEPPFRWYPIKEDESLPCEDELKYIESKVGHSALDHTHWEKETFFDLNDPELIPGESGRIDWLLEHYNGTKEKPNKDLIMRSPIVRIGGYEWQIKFYPKGNRTDYLSVYLENVTTLSPEFKEKSDQSCPALPVLSGTPKIFQRAFVAAQVSVVMYNPAEPRVYESKIDAHQYHKKASDFGWKYFSSTNRHDFHLRMHGQRQAILRGDQLGFTAYIRIVNDPTGCMWDASSPGTDASLAATGLRPFDTLSPQIAAVLPLLHLRPFRDILYKHSSSSPLFTLLQIYMDKVLARRLKRKHLRYSTLPDGCDVVDVLQKIVERLKAECSPKIVADLDELCAGFNSEKIPVCQNRLATENCPSVQGAIHRTHVTLSTPAVLALELERQKFSKINRKWEKVTNDVYIDESIVHNDVEYSLYAFVKHSGPLGTNNYIPYVRPGGSGTMWYAYKSGQVRCLTQKQALRGERERSMPSNSGTQYPYHRPPSVDPIESDATPYLVFYVRQDVSNYSFTTLAEEHWNIPETVRKPRRPQDGNHAGTGTKPSHGPGKVHPPPANIIDFGVAGNRFLPPPPGMPETPGHITENLNPMDGDDVVMSDIEEGGSRTPIHANAALDASANGNGITVERCEYRDLPDSPEVTRPVVVNFFSGEYYDGLALERSNLYHGCGRLIRTNGDEYTGSLVRGLPSGKGTMIYAATGNIYTGDWLEGQHHGQGTYTELATGNVFEGGWKEGKRSGNFVLRGTVTDEDKGRCQICYENDMTTAFYECGHVLACKECAAQIEICPVCRKRVLARLELYGVKVSME